MGYPEGGFECHGNVMRHLKMKKVMLQRGDADHREIRPLLLGLSGVFRGVEGGAALVSLEKNGYRDVFDDAVAVSTSAPAVAYFLSGQAEIGETIYSEECLAGKFIPLNLWSLIERFVLMEIGSGSLMDTKDLCNVFRGIVSNKPLNQQALKLVRTRFGVVVTRCHDGEGIILNAQKTEPDPVEAIRAAIAVPGVSNGKVSIGGVEYIDGVGSMPFPIDLVIREFDPTDILVLANRPEGDHEHVVEQLLTEFATHGESERVREEFRNREQRFNEGLESLRNWKGRWDIVWNDHAIRAVETDAEKLRSAARRAEARMTRHIRDETK